MVKQIPKSIQNFSILQNPLNNCNLDTIMAVINMKSLIKSYSGITMKCFGSDMSPEEAFVKVSVNLEKTFWCRQINQKNKKKI